jgi:hypothetical protein
VTRDESHVGVGGLLAQGQSGRKDDHGKERTHAHMQESMHKESDNWRKNITCMGGIPNFDRVRVLVIHCKWLKIPIDINIDMQVSEKGWSFHSKFTVVFVEVRVLVTFH